jgi:hypothetical protein
MGAKDVCVLFHPGDPHREKVWRWTSERWLSMGARVSVGCSDRGLFASRNAAAEAAGAWDVAVFADADVAIESPSQLRTACARALTVRGYVCLYDRFCYLTEPDTEAVMGGRPLAETSPFEIGVGFWTGCFAISRPLWGEIGGFDERFAGRAGQDIAFVKAAATLGSLERVTGDAYHLWHPPAQGRVIDGIWSHRYQDAEGDPAAMRRLLRKDAT